MAPSVIAVEYMIIKLGRNVLIYFLVLSNLLQMPVYVYMKAQVAKETKKNLSCHKVHYWDRKTECGDQLTHMCDG